MVRGEYKLKIISSVDYLLTIVVSLYPPLNQYDYYMSLTYELISQSEELEPNIFEPSVYEVLSPDLNVRGRRPDEATYDEYKARDGKISPKEIDHYDHLDTMHDVYHMLSKDSRKEWFDRNKGEEE